MAAEACQNCKAHGAEWIKRRGGDKRKPRYYSSCRVGRPDISSESVGESEFGEAWVGVHPWIPYGYWCTAYEAGEDSTAVSIEFGKNVKLKEKQKEQI